MAGTILPNGKNYFASATGTPLAGGKVYTYTAGTTTPKATYTTYAASVANANPVILDARGEAAIYWVGDYDVVLKDAAGVTIWGPERVNQPDSAGTAAALDATLRADLASAANATLGDYLIGVKSTLTGGGSARTQHAKNADFITPQDFGAVGDGTTDDTTAIQAAVTAAVANKNKTIHVPCGIYKITGTITIGQGVAIIGEGSQGSNESYGVVFKHYSVGDCFVWDGSGADNCGTGGGLRNALIVKADTYQAGTAIKVIATSDNKRPGEMMFDNVLIYGVGSTVGAGGNGGLWARCAVFDGTACVTNGARGVRQIHLRKFRCAEATTANETIVINGVTHFFADGLSIDDGDATAAQGVTIKGINENIFINGLDSTGTFTVIANTTSNITTATTGDSITQKLHVIGTNAGTVVINDTQVQGTMLMSRPLTGSPTTSCYSQNMRIVSENSTAWTATVGTTLTDKTGDATVYRMAWDTERFDNGNNAGLLDNKVRVLIAGVYAVNTSLTLSGLLVGHTSAVVTLARLDSDDSTVLDEVSVTVNPYAISVSTVATISVAGLFKVDYDDRFAVFVTVSGSTKVIDFLQDSGTTRKCVFSGHLV